MQFPCMTDIQWFWIMLQLCLDGILNLMKIFCVSIKYRDAAIQLENSNTETLSLQLSLDSVVKVWPHIQVVKNTFNLPGVC